MCDAEDQLYDLKDKIRVLQNENKRLLIENNALKAKSIEELPANYRVFTKEILKSDVNPLIAMDESNILGIVEQNNLNAFCKECNTEIKWLPNIYSFGMLKDVIVQLYDHYMENENELIKVGTFGDCLAIQLGELTAFVAQRVEEEC